MNCWIAALLVLLQGTPEDQKPPPDLPDRIMEEIDAERLRASIDALAGFGTRHSASETDSSRRGIGAARRWLRSQLEHAAEHSGGRMEVVSERFEAPRSRRLPGPVEMVNVYALLPGIRPDSRRRHYYVIGHYDSRASRGGDAESDAPGANDDGSGTALVLELARVLAGHELDSSVVFLCTAGEEQGLFGAKHHAEAALERGLSIQGALNNDIVGDPSGPPDGRESAREQVRLFSAGLPAQPEDREFREIRRLSSASDSTSRQLARYVADVARRYRTAVQPLLVFREDRFLRGGDHTAFSDQGIPAVRFTEVFENFDRQHQDVREEQGVQYGDLPEFVDEEYLADVARLNAAVLVSLANAPAVPQNARIATRELSNDTKILWDANQEEDLAGYEVVWRRTTESQWQHVRDLGDVNEITLPLSKDNWFFGVRAYDQDGYRSPVAFPGIAR